MAKLITEATHLQQQRKALLALRGLNGSVHTAETTEAPSRASQSRETALQSERRTLIASRPSKKRVDVLIIEQRAAKSYRQDERELQAAVAARRRRTDLRYAETCEEFEAALRPPQRVRHVEEKPVEQTKFCLDCKRELRAFARNNR